MTGFYVEIQNLCACILNAEDKDGKVGNTYKGQRTNEMLDTGAALRYWAYTGFGFRLDFALKLQPGNSRVLIARQ